MARIVAYHPDAVGELLEWVRWLAADEPALGTRALAAVVETLSRTLEFPGSGPVYWKDFRSVMPRPFKLLILYREIPAGIGVAAFMDGRMDPATIRQRLRSR